MDFQPSYHPSLDLIKTLRQSIIDEIIKSAGVTQHRLRRWIFRIALTPPAQRFAHVAARFDYITKYYNFQEAARDLLYRFVDQIDIIGMDQIPREGPLLVAANHPGTYDGISLISSIPRDDLKVVISGIPFTQELENAGQYFIYSPPPEQTYGRMETLRSSVRHLRSGGALLLFPTGRVDPDPSLSPGAESALERWSRSLEILIRKAPDTQILPTIVSGVITPKSLHHPLTHLLRKIERYKTAQIVQISGQLFSPNRNKPVPKITFGTPFLARQLLEKLPIGDSDPETQDTVTILNAVIDQAKHLLSEHLDQFGILPPESVDQRIAPA
jgi:1-acyl-sn-glycerol-3-phosphate acyltransferase